ncbi:MAG: CoA transferase, partial [Pseudomonadales bacterium]
MTAPLAGIKVLEVASWLAAPSCAALMADMGAEVIKVEPPAGDTYRKMYDALLGDGSV